MREHYLQCSGGFYDGAKEAIYEAKASEEGPPGTRNRRGVLFVGRRSDRISERADSRFTVPEYLSASRNLPRRGRALRRQPCHILCLRQGRHRQDTGRPAIGLVAMRRLRRRMPMRRLCLERLWRMRRLWRLLLVNRTLPRLLRQERAPPTSKDTGYGRALIDPVKPVLFACADRADARVGAAEGGRVRGQMHRPAPAHQPDDGAIATRTTSASQW
jgi:hypothetical protein